MQDAAPFSTEFGSRFLRLSPGISPFPTVTGRPVLDCSGASAPYTVNACTAAGDREPYLKYFKGDWATVTIMIQALHSYCEADKKKKIIQILVNNSDDEDDKDDDKGQDESQDKGSDDCRDDDDKDN
ncbi:hypothetical protein M422DRAFT_271840 [Sphaerobolus stellatus SS14]|uniref:Uncharacterized protein n=1 Tax=Sphaerobolus stellatus (strain SS14) TaxID=990650 RepID=A0A0C9UP08_SPHS4|nr:hypothetical protein M422DRAFT_271840 [Sphaerobolus stellatus SS14]